MARLEKDDGISASQAASFFVHSAFVELPEEVIQRAADKFKGLLAQNERDERQR